MSEEVGPGIGYSSSCDAVFMQWKGNNSSVVRLTSREITDSLHTLGSTHTHRVSEVNLRACLDFTCVSVSHVYGSSIFDR